MSTPPPSPQTESTVSHDDDDEEARAASDSCKRKRTDKSQKPRKTATPKKPKPGASESPTNSRAWDPSHDELTLRLKSEGKTNKQIVDRLAAVFSIQKTPQSVRMRIAKLQAANHEWGDEQIAKLKEAVYDFLGQKTDKYSVVYQIFSSKNAEFGIKKGAVVEKLKALEKEDGGIPKLS